MCMYASANTHTRRLISRNHPRTFMIGVCLCKDVEIKLHRAKSTYIQMYTCLWIQMYTCLCTFAMFICICMSTDAYTHTHTIPKPCQRHPKTVTTHKSCMNVDGCVRHPPSVSLCMSHLFVSCFSALSISVFPSKRTPFEHKYDTMIQRFWHIYI